jgi:hypothetical protein
MADTNTENGDNPGYGSQRKDIMDQGLMPMRTTRKGADENSNEMNGHENWTRNEGADENTNEMNGHENWTGNGKPNRNDHMDETEIIILKKRRRNTERTMTPGGETNFLYKFRLLVPVVNIVKYHNNT